MSEMSVTQSPKKGRPDVVARRLRRLLDYLNVSYMTFANDTGLDQSYVHRLLTGERGNSASSRGNPKLVHAVEHAYGIAGHYWSSQVDLDPATCKLSAQPQGSLQGGQMGVMTGYQMPSDDLRRRLAEFAANKGESGDMVVALLKMDAPPGADAVWWLTAYLDLKEKLPKRR
jgi:hypothetical protein